MHIRFHSFSPSVKMLIDTIWLIDAMWIKLAASVEALGANVGYYSVFLGATINPSSTLRQKGVH